jgi:hypothetical protein
MNMTISFRPSKTFMKKIISLGGGVQSTAMLLMSLIGQFEKPDVAVFCDTGNESAATYSHLEFLRIFAKVRNFPLHTISQGNILDNLLNAENFASIPFFLMQNGKRGMVRRQCTSEYKIKPFLKFARDYAGLRRYEHCKSPIVEKWLGISTDEAHRMRDSHERFIVNRYPLIELGMSRVDCENWLLANDFVIPPKSSCLICPFHSDREWRFIKNQNNGDFEQTVEFEKKLSAQRSETFSTDALYLHKSCRPLGEINFEDNQQSLFGEDCSGSCGV